MNDKFYQLSLPEIKEIQLNIMDAVDEFCKRNNIKYSMAAGTLLGAVRHKGYIPWDDDIDICMLREDFEKFVNLFPNHYKGVYELACLNKTRGWHVAFAKIFDNRTIVIDCVAKVKKIGVCIDLFPMDDVPDDDFLWESHKRTLNFAKSAVSSKISRINKKSIKSLLAILLRKCKCLLFPLSYYVNKVDKLARSYNGKGYSRVYESVLGSTQGSKPIPKSLFADISPIPFEDRMYMGFKNNDKYLEQTYGDYMTLPPEDERIPKHPIIAFMKK